MTTKDLDDPWSLRCPMCERKISSHNVSELKACLHNISLSYSKKCRILTKLYEVLKE